MSHSESKGLGSYGKLCTQFYDLDKPNAPPEALRFYLEHARVANGAVLESMCGSGRFLIPLFEAGIDIDGLDASGEMLEACRVKCKQKGLKPRLYQQFLNDMQLLRKYKLIIIPAESFGLVTNLEQVKESLRRLFEGLQPGGRLIFEIEFLKDNQSSNLGNWGGRWLKRPDDALMVLSWLPSFDAKTQTSKSLLRYEVFKDNQLLETELEEFDLRFYTRGEIESLLYKAGFVGIRMFKINSDVPMDETDLEITIECMRPEIS